MSNVKKNLFIYILLFQFGLILNAQGFIESIELNNMEPNSSFLIGSYDDSFIISGDYFDQTIERWTGFYAKYDSKGNRTDLLIEQNDFIVQLLQNGNLLFNKNGFEAVGFFQDSIYSFRYDIDKNELSSKKFLSQLEFDFVGGGIYYDQNIILFGRNYLDNADRNVKVINILQDTILTYTEIDSLTRNVAGNCGTNSKGEIVISCLNTEEGKEHYTYLIYLDENLNKIRNTKDFNSVSPSIRSTGFLVDSNDNTLLTGSQKRSENGFIVSYPTIAKFDPDGNHLWTKRIGKNINNIQGIGRWESIIESIDGDGYIIAGSSSYENLDTIIAKAAIAKIDRDGFEIWHNEFGIDSSSQRIVEEFNDIIATDNGYVACGTSSNFLSDGTRPWRKSLIIKIDQDGVLDTTMVSTTNMNSFDSNDILIYPNPVNHILTVENCKDVVQIRINDVSGSLVDKINNASGLNIIQINVSDLLKGVYFLKLIGLENKVLTRKIVIY